jgi:saccharopine dehydrogenase (NAD+, L-lysine forming)
MRNQEGKVLIIGAGGVGGVTTHKCAQFPKVFQDITLASRTVSKCDAIAESVFQKTGQKVKTSQVDADDTGQLVLLIELIKPDIVINVALPYQNLSIMDACLATSAPYIDTACYEPLDEARYSHTWQWAYHDRYREKGLMAVLGCGFDPGQTNIYIAYAIKNYFENIHSVAIEDCNAGDHGRPFATNFNPEINIREITGRGKYYENGEWIETDPLSVHRTIDFPGIGPREGYLMNHEELESLAKHFPDIGQIQFWMTFGQEYLTHLRVLQNVGMTRIDPILFNGIEIVPIQFLKALMPEPSSLAENYTGKTWIGCTIEGIAGDQWQRYRLSNTCDHAECFREVGANAVSYTAGVPPALGAKLVLEGKWKGAGVFNVEQLDPDPFMAEIGAFGLPWTEEFLE